MGLEYPAPSQVEAKDIAAGETSRALCLRRGQALHPALLPQGHAAPTSRSPRSPRHSQCPTRLCIPTPFRAWHRQGLTRCCCFTDGTNEHTVSSPPSSPVQVFPCAACPSPFLSSLLQPEKVLPFLVLSALSHSPGPSLSPLPMTGPP